MKRRITVLALVLLLCLAYCGSALAEEAALTLQAGVKSGDQYATIRSGSIESLTVSYVLYKVESGKLVSKASASMKNNGSTNSATARTTVSLTSGSYEMHVTGGSSSHPVSEIRYFTI